MQTIQFKAIVQEGIIKIPEIYRASIKDEMQVIVLFSNDNENALYAARQLATLGGSEKQLADIPRRREF
jgi:hypothetical protein